MIREAMARTMQIRVWLVAVMFGALIGGAPSCVSWAALVLLAPEATVEWADFVRRARR